MGARARARIAYTRNEEEASTNQQTNQDFVVIVFSVICIHK